MPMSIFPCQESSFRILATGLLVEDGEMVGFAPASSGESLDDGGVSGRVVCDLISVFGMEIFSAHGVVMATWFVLSETRVPERRSPFFSSKITVGAAISALLRKMA